MHSLGKLILFVFAFLVLIASANAQSPREELQQMVEQLQKTPNDNALREKIIKLAISLEPAPEISEEARRSFIIGEALFKQAKKLRPAFEAANAFRTATTLAPWWSDAYWNLAAAHQLAGQYVSVKESLRLYMLTNLSAEDRRIAQDRLYAIEADIITAESSVSGGLTGFWQRSSYKNMTNGEWIKDNPDSVRSPVYEIQQAGSAYSIKCVRCDPKETQTYLISADANAIHFKNQESTYYDVHECRLNDSQLSCISTYEIPTYGKERQDERYSKRSVCEDVGGPGIPGYLVLCK